jgi:hypothetical protein
VAELRDEKDLTETVAELRGQVGVLLNLIGGNSNGNGNTPPRLFEASETVMQRRVKVQSAPRRREKPVNQRP